MRGDIFLCVCAEIRFVHFLAVGEFVRNIEGIGFRMPDIFGVYEFYYAVGKSDRFLGGFRNLTRGVSCFGLFDRVRAKMRIAIAYIPLLLCVREVLAVVDNDAVIRAAVFVELYDEIIELELAAPDREDGARLTSAKVTERARLRYVDVVKRGNIAPSREAVREHRGGESRCKSGAGCRPSHRQRTKREPF